MPQPPDSPTPAAATQAVPSSEVGAPAKALGATFVRGMAWGSTGMLVGKLGSAAATLCLGWIFGRGEYGAASAALSAAMIGDVLTDGGLRRVLITRGGEYPQLARTSFFVSLAFNLLGCALMLAVAAVYRAFHPEAVGQLVVFAIALVLSTLGSVQRSKLSIDLRFAQAAFLGTASSLLRNALIVAFAWWGFGPMAFALPLIVVNLWEAAYLRRVVGPLPPSQFDLGLARQLILQGKWVILAMIGGSLISRGDYLVTTWILTEGQRGDYYFAFQLTLAVFAPLSVGASAVVQPIMARLRSEPERQANAFVRMVRISLFVAAPLSMISALTAPLLIHLAWHGKWDDVAGAVQVLAATECVRQLLTLSLSTLDARGEWHRSAWLILVDGLLTVLAAVAGSATGSVFWLATIIAAQRTIISILEAAYVHHTGGGKGRTIFVQVLPPLLLAGALASATIIASSALSTNGATSRWVAAAMAIPAGLIYVLVCRLVLPRRFDEVAGLIRARFRR